MPDIKPCHLKFSLERVKALREGDTVFSCGFGFFKDLHRPSLYKGEISRLVFHEGKCLFIQHSAKTYGGQSGGALFDKEGYIVGLLFKNSVLNINQEKTKKLNLCEMCTAVSAE